MKNNDALKKHHFWILLGLVPLFVLIAVLTISSSVGGEIEKRNKEIEDAKGGLSKLSNAKSNALMDLMDGVIKKVDGKRGSLWKANWDKQENLYVWPKSDDFKNFVRKSKGADGKEVEVPVRIEDLKFGEPIVESKDQFEEFRKPEFYRSLYSTAGLTPDQKDKLPPGFIAMADSIAPTQFNGGWERILRHVTDFGIKKLTSDQIWLMMEDVWVQRSMLQAVKSVNDQMSEFQRIIYKDATGTVIDDPDKPSPQDPLRRKFRSRVWEVALEVKTRGNKTFITGSLENITERLQVLGIGKNMTLKVWLEKNRDGGTEGIEPFEFRIGSDFIPGKGGTKRVKDKAGKDIEVPSNIVTTQPDESNDKEFDKYINIIPPGKTVAEIVKVEQVFDTQTVPVRRVEAMAIGTMTATDSRYAAMGLLLPPPSPPFTAVTTTPAAGTQPGSILPGGMPMSGFDPKSMFGSGTATGVVGAGGGPIASVIDGNRRRYVEITPQVRRMPVAIMVVVDQAYIQDMLLAFANSPLRFQITQVTWHRFRGNLGGTGSASDSMGPGGSVQLTQPGIFGNGFGRSSDPDMMYPGTRGRPFPGSTPFPMSSPPIPAFGSPSGGMPPGGMGGFDMYGEGGSLTTVSEAQLTSGLVELSIYGIVSLYEKYNAAADTAVDGAAPKEGEAKDKEPKDKDPKEKDPKEKDALPTAPANPKMRVRRRA